MEKLGSCGEITGLTLDLQQEVVGQQPGPKPERRREERCLETVSAEEHESNLSDFETLLNYLEFKIPITAREKAYNSIKDYSKRLESGRISRDNSQHAKLNSEIVSQIINDIHINYRSVEFETLVMRCNFVGVLSRLRFADILTHVRLPLMNSLGEGVNDRDGSIDFVQMLAENSGDSENIHEKFFSIALQGECIKLVQTQVFRENNWIYLCGLPYEFDLLETRTNFLKVLGFLGEVERIFFYQYKDFLEQRDLYEDLSFTSSDFENISKMTSDIAMNFSEVPGTSNKEEVASETQPKIDSNYSEVFVKENLSKNSKKIFDLARKMSMVRYNKSYCFVKFRDRTTKEQVMSPSLTLFGLYINDKCYRVENAEMKRSLILKNLSINSTVGEITGFLNEIFRQNGLQTFEVPVGMYNKSLASSNFILTFKNFEESARALALINSLKYFNRKICAMHIHGGNAVSLKDTEKLYRQEILSQNKNILSVSRNQIENAEYLRTINDRLRQNGHSSDLDIQSTLD